MLNLNPELIERNPVMRDVSFDFLMNTRYELIDSFLHSYLQQERKTENEFIQFFEYSIYKFLDFERGNLFQYLMLRHGAHYVVEAIAHYVMKMDTCLSKLIKLKIKGIN